MSLLRCTVLVGLCSFLFSGCGPAQRIEPGLYRAVLTVAGGDLPFGLELKTDANNRTVAYLVNGAERVRVDEVKLTPRSVEMSLPGFGNTLSAKLKRGKLQGAVLHGAITLVKRDGKEQKIPLRLERGEQYRFFRSAAAAPAKVEGRWAVTFTNAAGVQTPAVGEFTQDKQYVTGTFLTPTGDHRFLAGEVRNNELFLSTFDGANAYLYKAQLTPQRELQGRFWSGLSQPQSWTARRDLQASLPDANVAVGVRDKTWAFGFTFPDPQGNAVSLADKQFRGKVLVIALGGSWCPNCHDEAAFLASLHKKYREQGLEVVGLMFEHFGEFDKAAAAVKKFRRKFAIEYPTLIAGTSDKAQAGRKLPLLSAIKAFPTTIFMDRSGRIRRIHSGFSGPATGEHYEKLTREFTSVVESLLAENPAS